MSERKIVQDGALHCVISTDGYILEVFDSRAAATAYLAEYEASTPRTAGEVKTLADKHGALFHAY